MTDTKEYTENLQKLLAESRQPSVSRKDLDLAFGEEFVESVAARLESTNALQFDETLDQDALNKCANHRLFNFLQRNQRDPHPSLEKGHFFELRKWTTAAAAERDVSLWRLLGTMATQTVDRGENRLDNPTTMTARRMMLRLIEVVMGEFEWSRGEVPLVGNDSELHEAIAAVRRAVSLDRIREVYVSFHASEDVAAQSAAA